MAATAATLVIADPDAELAELTAQALRSGYGALSICAFSDAHQAAALIARSRPEVIISSPELSRIGGLDLIALGHKRWGEELPAIVLVTGSGLNPGRHLRVSHNIIYLEKPFTKEALYTCVAELTGRVPEDSGLYEVELTADSEPAPSLVDTADSTLSSMTPLPIARPLGQLHEECGDFAMSLTVHAIQATFKQLEQIDGFIGVALADCDSGVCFGVLDNGSLDVEVAASANAELVRSTRNVVGSLDPSDAVEDILISLDTQYHLIRPVHSHPNLFYYLALDRAQANLAMARFTIAQVERELPSETQ